MNDQLKGYDALRESWGPSGVPEWLRTLQTLVPPNQLIVSNDRNVDKIAGSREIFDEGSEGRDYMENVLDTQRLMLHAEAARMDDLLFQYNMAAANIYVANKYDDQPTTDPEDALGTSDLGYGPSQPGGYGKSGRGDVDGAAAERGRGPRRRPPLMADRAAEREQQARGGGARGGWRRCRNVRHTGRARRGGEEEGRGGQAGGRLSRGRGKKARSIVLVVVLAVARDDTLTPGGEERADGSRILSGVGQSQTTRLSFVLQSHNHN